MNPILAFAASGNSKICLNLLDANNQLEGWFSPFTAILAVIFVAACLRIASRATSGAQLSGGAVAGILVGCVVLLGAGWLMSQFFNPTC